MKMNLPSWPQDDHEPSFKLFSLPSRMIKGASEPDDDGCESNQTRGDQADGRL